MSENYIHAIEVGTEEVPIKLNHSLGKDTNGYGVSVSSLGGSFSISNSSGNGVDFFRVSPGVRDNTYISMSTPAGGRIYMDRNGYIDIQRGSDRIQLNNKGIGFSTGAKSKMTVNSNEINIESNRLFIRSNYGSYKGYDGDLYRNISMSDNDSYLSLDTYIVGTVTRQCIRLDGDHIKLSSIVNDDEGYLRLDGDIITVSPSIASSGVGLTELYEWKDGNLGSDDRVGRFVTLSGEFIEIASPNSDYILGAIDPNPYLVGNSYDRWPNKYLTDVYGRIIYEEIWVEPQVNESGEVVAEGRMHKSPVVNPDYDESQYYIFRQHRSEYAAITSKGKVVMIDDGTCVPGKFATVGEGGIATHSDDNIAVRVLSRVDENHVRVYIDSVFRVKH